MSVSSDSLWKHKTWMNEIIFSRVIPIMCGHTHIQNDTSNAFSQKLNQSSTDMYRKKNTYAEFYFQSKAVLNDSCGEFHDLLSGITSYPEETSDIAGIYSWLTSVSLFVPVGYNLGRYEIIY